MRTALKKRVVATKRKEEAGARSSSAKTLRLLAAKSQGTGFGGTAPLYRPLHALDRMVATSPHAATALASGAKEAATISRRLSQFRQSATSFARVREDRGSEVSALVRSFANPREAWSEWRSALMGLLGAWGPRLRSFSFYWSFCPPFLSVACSSGQRGTMGKKTGLCRRGSASVAGRGSGASLLRFR